MRYFCFVMSEPLLHIRNLQVDFRSDGGTTTAVRDINFQLEKGAILGIVGESGSGKSVTSMAVMGILPKSSVLIPSGEILYTKRNGEQVDLLKISESEMRALRGNEIAMIFQEPMTSLNPTIKCGPQVVEALVLHQGMSAKEARIRTIELFEEVELPRPEKLFNSYPHQISGGQKQRVMIAMAISCKPSLLIADEPTTALDVTVQKTILEILKNLQKKYGMSIIFITHDLGVIAQIANRVLVMYRGDLIEEGSTKDIFSNPKQPYTHGLIACRPPMEKRFTKLPTIGDFVDSEGKHQFVFQEIDANQRAENHKKLYAEPPLMEVRNLNTHFVSETNFFGRPKAWVKAVNNVNFEVYRGETLGLVGESGCGKTSLGRTLLRMTQSNSGQVLYKGKDLTKMSAREMKRMRKDVQIIFQDPYSSLNPRMTIGQAIEEPLKVHHILPNHKERKARVIELLEKVNLNESQYNRSPHEFRGGQRQRVVIARTLALEPEFIICDESVSALDVSVQAQVLNLLNELKEEFQFTYIFISHDLSVVKFMSDRMIVMKEGEIVEMGEADQIYAHPEQDYTRTLIDSIPLVEY
jgi:peptide/nickel transport system ATP-binding protein